jgi:protein-S-isoprenylcysteine O-methyltransferase Ste14
MAAFAVAALNTAYGVVYNAIEDRRLVRLFGNRYGDYVSEVPHIVPRAMSQRLRLLLPAHSE